ncbi:MAG TPA: hypothetical protein VK943_10870, partial [Arenibaculum sp.]|nr:hypothetical protein [Arenibaculum sp.]
GPGSTREFPAALALGGSDAHLDDFDRVVTLFRAPSPPTAGDFTAAMLAARSEPAAARERFSVNGHGIGTLTLYREVMTLLVRNIRRLRPHLRGLRLQTRILRCGVLAAAAELRRMDREAACLQADLRTWLDADEQGASAATWPLAADLGRQ